MDYVTIALDIFNGRFMTQRKEQLKKIKLPKDFDYQHWIDRWDRMQQRYLVKRNERFDIIVRLIMATQGSVEKILDLGCGTGSLMLQLLEAFSQAQVFGIDFDPTLLILAESRLSKYGVRAKTILTDLRDASWLQSLPDSVDAVVSATALHWFTPEQLEVFYAQISKILRSGGIFLNADHISSACASIQKAWEQHRAEMREQEGNFTADDWDGFWDAYSQALGLDVRKIHQRVIGGWEGGVEEGLPLAWHFDKLRDNGFSYVDCFWRCDCDAIYGGILNKL